MAESRIDHSWTSHCPLPMELYRQRVTLPANNIMKDCQPGKLAWAWVYKILIRIEKCHSQKDTSSQSKAVAAELSEVHQANKHALLYPSLACAMKLSKVVKLYILVKKMQLKYSVGEKKGKFWYILCWSLDCSTLLWDLTSDCACYCISNEALNCSN